MIQAQMGREAERKELSRDEFLRKSAPQVSMLAIHSTDHPRFARAFELINKTNQFNTTGRRWTMAECAEFLTAGGLLYAFEVSDAYTGYGLVGAVMVKDRAIEQWVMSCRVLGYQIEEAVMAAIIAAIPERNAGPISGRLIKTDVNFPCRNLFADCKFVEQGDRWILQPGTVVPVPAHVTMLNAIESTGMAPDP
jgi:FkbH-like protein